MQAIWGVLYIAVGWVAVLTAAKGRLDLRIVAGLGAAGLAMGLLAVLGMPPQAEGPLWVAVMAASGITVALRTPGRRFLHGLAAGLLMGFAAPGLQSAFFDVYASHHPQFQGPIEHEGIVLDPRFLFLATGAIVGPITGCLIGGIGWGVGKWVERRSSVPRTTPPSAPAGS